MTGESRGFGFVSFSDNDTAEDVLGRAHTIMGRRCEVRLPRAKVYGYNFFIDNKIFLRHKNIVGHWYISQTLFVVFESHNLI